MNKQISVSPVGVYEGGRYGGGGGGGGGGGIGA